MVEHTKTTKKPILINLADKLLETQTELDELALAVALDNSEKSFS